MRVVFSRLLAALVALAPAASAQANEFHLGPFRQQLDFGGGAVAVDLSINQTVVGRNELRLRGVLRAEAETSLIFARIGEALRAALPLRRTYDKKLGFVEIAECDLTVDALNLGEERIGRNVVDVAASAHLQTGGFNCPYAASDVGLKIRFAFATRADAIGLSVLRVEADAPALRGLGRLLGDEYLVGVFRDGVTASVKNAAAKFALRFPTLDAFEGAYLGSAIAASGDKLIVSVAFQGRLKDAATTEALRNGGLDLNRGVEFVR